MISTNYNPSVLTTQRNLNLASFSLNTALERMSTGYKVNCAADDAAGMFVASNLNANIRGLKQAQKNAQDGISLLNTAEGSLSNMTNILNRLRDLAVQGANGVYDENSLDAMQNEADSLVAQLKQIQEGTLFNGKSIFNTNATWNLTTQNTDAATISTLSGGGVSAKTPDTNSLAGINTLNSTPDAKSSSGFIQQINRLSEDEAIAQGYTVIKTAQDLDNIRNDLDGKYILMNDIDLSSYSNWTSLGDGTNSFTGELNGNGFVIDNLSVNGSWGGGLFYDLSGAHIQNLGIENVNISGHTSVGALAAGSSAGTIINNVYSTGTINSSFNSGGVIGSASVTTITNSCSSVTISASYNCHGGLVGFLYYSKIENSYATGNISGGSDLGGLAGSNNTSIIKNSYANVDINGSGSIGGLAGNVVNGALIENSYSTGNISGTSQNIGGISGLLDSSSSIKNSVWNTDKIAIGIGDNQGSAITNKGLSTSEMKNIRNFIELGWDATIWDFRPGALSPPKFRPHNEIDPIRLQIGTNEKNNSVIFVDTNFDIGYFIIDFSTTQSCAEAIYDIDSVLEQINTKRAEFGAAINRLNSILESQTTTIQNFTSAKSTIMDADIANESADFVKNQILQQTSSALLAQSQNFHASIVLSLIG